MPHYRRADWFCIAILTLMIAVMVTGYLNAQTQDFFNGTFSTGIKDVADRVARVEGRLDYIMGGLLVSLLAQVVQIATHVRSRK